MSGGGGSGHAPFTHASTSGPRLPNFQRNAPNPHHPSNPPTPPTPQDMRTSEGTFLTPREDPDGVLSWLEEKIAAVTLLVGGGEGAGGLSGWLVVRFGAAGSPCDHHAHALALQHL